MKPKKYHYIRIRSGDLNLEFLDLDEQVEEKIFNFIAHQIIIGTPERIKKYENKLPMDAYLRGGGFFPRLKYAHSYWQKKFENEKYFLKSLL
ncbi:MAG: hypothetical protein ACTSQW_00160 [Promethearchaeota archaeon]